MLTTKFFLLIILAAYVTCARNNDDNKKGKSWIINGLRKCVCGDIDDELDNRCGSQEPIKTELGINLTKKDDGREFHSISRKNMKYELDDITDIGKNSGYFTITPSQREDDRKQTDSTSGYSHHFDDPTVTGGVPDDRRGSQEPSKTVPGINHTATGDGREFDSSLIKNTKHELDDDVDSEDDFYTIIPNQREDSQEPNKTYQRKIITPTGFGQQFDSSLGLYTEYELYNITEASEEDSDSDYSTVNQNEKKKKII
ncbi:uncharacterized protein LOC126833005 [Adelges cooleyi]|uniref:uncharacterized protein LOC126833005 n=1 Tax=Adelges cooleyi TaxID=133065 RepID=UPI00217F2831|nr:uncharacterized protein LOC126833005 [Adelges cooleyi]